MAYIRAGRAQRSGGWNIPFNTLVDQPFKPEQLTDVELGLKATGMEGRFSVNSHCLRENTTTCSACWPA